MNLAEKIAGALPDELRFSEFTEAMVEVTVGVIIASTDGNRKMAEGMVAEFQSQLSAHMTESLNNGVIGDIHGQVGNG